MRILLISGDAPTESIEQLTALGYDVILLPTHDSLPRAISSHPDSLIFRGDDRLIIDKDYYCENEALFLSLSARCPSLRIELSLDRLGDEYPYDTRLNAIRIGNKLFCHLKTISNAIIKYASDKGLTLVDTKQGYPACSTLKISENAIICADRGLSALYKGHGISVYEIDAGGILLPPYQYGFIGGASVALGKEICFFGELTTHPSHKVIANALKEHSHIPVSICRGALRDLGGGILL